MSARSGVRRSLREQMVGLEELVSAWRSNPDARSTISLAQALARSGRENWIRELGQHALTWHVERADVLIAVGQMYQSAGLLPEAQTALVAAGKAGGREPRPFFLLGQVLLARGDAVRAEKVLHRAIELGYRSDDVLTWHHRAAGFVALQQAQGLDAVARAVQSAPPVDEPPPPPPPALRVPLPSAAGVGRASPPNISAFDGLGASPGSASDPPRPAPSAPRHAAPTAPEPTPSLSGRNRLDTLVGSGAVETDASPPAWQPVAPPARSGQPAFVFVLLSLVVVGTLVIGYAEIAKLRRHDAVVEIDARVDRLVRSGIDGDLRDSVPLLGRAFGLDPMNPATARLWLWQRVATLILEQRDDGLSDALVRARSAGLPEAETAVGRIAELVGAGDLAGAATLVARWDARAKTNPWFQLMAAVVLEQSGDARAPERYRAALSMDPELSLARLLQARLLLLENGGSLARSELSALQRDFGDRAEMRVLEGLAWALGSTTSAAAPSELDEPTLERLPQPLRAAAYLVNASTDLAAGDRKHAARTIRTGVALTRLPAALSRFGELALATGDEAAAREALRRLDAFREIYPSVRILAARIGLFAGRLDEAEAAVVGLSADAPHAALVDAAVAYESLAPAELEQAVQTLTNQTGHEFDAVKMALAVLRGNAVVDQKALDGLGEPTVAWGPLVAFDAAAEVGDTDFAERWAARWNGPDAGCAYRLRASRLARYHRQIHPSLAASAQAVACNRVPLDAWIERGLSLFAANDGAGLGELVRGREHALGSALPFLRALADVASNQPRRAQVDVAGIALPVSGSPLPLRFLAAHALVAARDLRAKQYTALLRHDMPRHAELALLP